MKTSICRTLLALTACCALLLLCMGMGGKPLGADDVASITKINISDKDVVSKNAPIIVSFSDDMVRPEDLNKAVAVEDMPFSIHPPVEGEGRWLTEKSFAYTTFKGYPRGKQYFVLLKDDLRSVSGKPIRYSFSFSSESVSVKAVWPRGYNPETKESTVVLGLDLQVTAAALQDHLTVKDASSGEALEFSVSDMRREASQHEIIVKSSEYRPKLALELAVDTTEDPHPLGLAKPYAGVVNIPSPAGKEAPVSSGTTQAAFSSPSNISFYSPYSNENDDGSITAYFPLTDGIALDQDYKKFIEVTPADVSFVLSSGGTNIVVSGEVKPGVEVTVKLLPGLLDSAGRSLQQDRSTTLKIQDRYPALRFAENGNYLTPVYGSRVALDIVNLDKVTVSLYRQYDNNLPFMSLYVEDTNLARSLVFKEIELSEKKNEILRRSLDLDSLAKGQQGVFILVVHGYIKVATSDGGHYYSYRSSDQRVVVLSDIGITTRVFPAGATVFASSLSTGKPVPNADVRIYSSSNQLLAQGKTGADGIFIVKQGSNWDSQLQPNITTVNTDSDISFLPCNWQSSISLPDSASRDYLTSGNEAFLYTPRGVFRPGEKVDIKAFVRDATHSVPAPFPVIFSVTSSRGLEIARGTAKLSAEGGAEYAFTLPTSAPTGEYTAALLIPGQERERLGLVRFSVEDFVPPRLEVAVGSKEESLVGSARLPVHLSGQYLFGAPGAGLSYELGYRVSPRLFSPKGWDGYLFGNMEKEFSSSFDLQYMTGELGGDGTVDVDFASPGWEPSSIASVQLVGSVQEDGGRWVTQTTSFTYYPTPFLLGMKVDEESLTPGREGKIDVAAVDPEGKTTDPGKLSVEISRIQGNWYTMYRDGRYIYTWSEQLTPLKSFTVESRDGKAVIPFTPPQYGRFLVRCSTEDGAVVAARRISAWGASGYSSEDGTGRMDQVELSFDKKEYVVGDTAKLSVKAPYAGTLLLGVESGEQLSTRVIPMPQPSAVIEIPVTGNMDPNVTVTAWVYRPVKAENKEWYAHRAYGSIKLVLSKAPHTLTVVAETPERAEPSKGLKIPFTVADAEGNPVSGEFSVALVDEGILSLTAFKTPDPLSFFMALRRSVGMSYDGYDAILRPEARATPLLIPGGDAAPEDYQGSLSTQQIFLAEFFPTVQTGADGKGEVFFDIPEYSGKGRLMIVGASGRSFLSGASQVRFARDVVVEAAAPRAVAPGDTFEISLKAFALENALSGNAEITVEADGPVTLSGPEKTSIPLGGNAGEEGQPAARTHSFAVAAKAENASGIATISVDVRVPGRDDLHFTKYIEIAVRPPYPRSSEVKSALIKAGDSEKLAFSSKWVKDTVKTSLTVTGSPVFSVLPALEYLREYPYGCLEQTVSRAWPYLTLHEVQTTLYPDAPEEANLNNTNEILSSIVTRIASMQTGDGGFGMWPGYSYSHSWKSVHAAFFLVEAKSRVPIPAAVLQRSLEYLRFLIAAPEGYFGNKKYANTTKAYVAFVLTRAGEPPLAWMQHLSGQQEDMWPSGRIFLAAAKALKAGNPAALRDVSEAQLRLDTAKLGYNDSLESSLRNQALLLMAWSLVAPEDQETRKLCVALADRIGKARWLTTQDAGMASMAFGYYLSKTKLDQSFTAEVTAAGKKLGDAAQGNPLLLGYSRMPLTADGNPEPVTIKVGGKGEAYAVYNVRGVSFDAPAPRSENMEVEWSWLGADGKKIEPSGSQVTLKRGDRITMEVRLRSGLPLSDAVLSILLPGGLEVENPRLKTSASGDGGDSSQDTQEGYAASEADYDEYDEEDTTAQRFGNGLFMDLREDRLLLFFDRLYPSREWTTYSFTMRAVSKGTFIIPPVAVEGMYSPEVNAITSAGKVVIQ